MKRIFTIPERSHGPGTVFFTWQKSTANYLVTSGMDSSVNIYDRHGERVDQVNLPGYCTGVAWDSEGDVIGIITDRSPSIIIWDSNSSRVQQVDTGFRDVLSLIVWSANQPVLAIGTTKGNLLIYNHRSSRKVPVLGKHTKKIIGGAWSDHSLLALVGEDRVLTVSNDDGDSVAISNLKGDGVQVKFARIRPDDRPPPDHHNCVSLVLNKKQLFVLNLQDSENPIVMAFQERYGQVVDYRWFGDGNVLVGFSMGYFVVVSTYYKDIGQEMAQFKIHRESLTTFDVCLKTKKIASSSENIIKINDLSDINDVQSVLTVDDERSISWMSWSDDGQLLAVGSDAGAVHVYLNKLNIIGSAFGHRIAFLSSLLELTVVDVSDETVIKIRIDVEPSLVAVGHFHAAVAMNNRVWFYSLGSGQDSGQETCLIRERECVGIVKSMKMNGDYAACLFGDGTVQLHLIENESISRLANKDDQRDYRMFPDRPGPGGGKITAVDLTGDFLIFATDTGTLEFFMLEDWMMVNVYRHSTGIKSAASDSIGIRVTMIDDRNAAFVYNAVTDVLIEIAADQFPSGSVKLLWESWPYDKNVFVACDSKTVHVYSHVRDTVDGPTVVPIGKVKIPFGQHPLLLYNGLVICQTDSGKHSNFVLPTHDFADKMNDRKRLKDELLVDILKLRRYPDAWKICDFLEDDDAWQRLGEAAINDLDVELAIRVFRHMKKPGLVHSLEQIRMIEERNLLAGHLAVCLKKYDLAQQLFLVSSVPNQALEMRKNLLQWNEALTLAKKLAPDQVPVISREYGLQLEFIGDYSSALQHFEKSLLPSPKSEQDEQHNLVCRAGVARNAIRCGQTKQGLDMALRLSDPVVNQECARLLESMKMVADAALLYEKAGDFDKATELYLKVKNTGKAADMLEKVTNKDIHQQFGKAKESEGRHREAVKAYLRAGDFLNAVRLYLDHLNNPGEAVKIVKETGSKEGAKMIAKFFQRINDVGSAIEFLILSGCHHEAFSLAQSTGQLDAYANILINNNSQINEQTDKRLVDDFRSIAVVYEQERDLLKAGRFFGLAGQYRKSVKYLLMAASSGPSSDAETEAIRLAIDSAARSNDEQVIRMVTDYLIGETDGLPKDFKFLFRLYMALKRFREAAKTAVIIAREEQNAGNYRNAHDLLFGMCQELKKQKIHVPNEMQNSLMLIHSYLLAKLWIKAGEHQKSALMLIRVANNLSRFPAHAVPILTSAVIECQRAGFKKRALEFATVLMKPEHRDLIDPKFKKKIETLVRKSAGVRREKIDDTAGEGEESSSPCPHCDRQLVDTELSCSWCRNNVPFCLATGWHLVAEDLVLCPACQFPAIGSHLDKLLQTDPNCPMCGQPIEGKELIRQEDVSAILKSDDNNKD